ncbi:MAG: ATPase domain-containing protein [Terriglobales bacterium]
MPRAKPKIVRTSLAKAPPGIQGLDEVTGGGLPIGRVTLVCGNAGCGKSLLAMEFLVHGAVRYGEPGVCMDFEETEEKLRANVVSLGFDLRELAKRKKLLVDYVAVERHEIAESVVESCRRLKLPVRDYLAAVLPGFGNLPLRCLPDLTPTVWAARHS